MKILLCASEISPIAKTGGLADMIGALAIYLHKLGVEVAVTLPKYRIIDRRGKELGELSIPVGENQIYGHIEQITIPDTDIPVFLIGQNHYYDRKELYTKDGKDYPDNLERYTFFCRAALELIRRRIWVPDLLHVHDWQTALIPIYHKTRLVQDPAFPAIKILFTIHNLSYQGLFPPTALPITGIGWEHFHMEELEFYNQLNLMKGGILFADQISTVSRTYSQEICTPEFGCGLEGVLQKRKDALTGIQNGVDYSYWSPEQDSMIAFRYSSDSAHQFKPKNKQVLQKIYDLPPTSTRAPLMGVITRLVEQKGMDLLAAIVPELIEMGAQLVILGTGDPELEIQFKELNQRYPQACGVQITFNERLAHQIEAGADIFLMPSRFEPSGLNQMYSLRYGTIPIVRATGGLADTVIDVDASSAGTGFSFQEPTAEELLATCRRAKKWFSHESKWNSLVQRAMQQDFSWEKSAGEYLDLYERMVGIGSTKIG